MNQKSKFSPGDLVKLKLTGEKGMVIEELPTKAKDGITAYSVRLKSNLAINTFYEFELEPMTTNERDEESLPQLLLE